MVNIIPDFSESFVNEDDIVAFEKALNAPERPEEEFIVALNDWRPIRQLIKPRDALRRRRNKSRVTRKDETREGFVYAILKWPLLIVVLGWIALLSSLYTLTRVYISQYEHWVSWRGRRNRLRKVLRQARTYDEWKEAAKALDEYYGAEEWKKTDAYAYYDYRTVQKILTELRLLRKDAQKLGMGTEKGDEENKEKGRRCAESLKHLLEACVKSNFAGSENPRLYSQTYYGTKERLQEFIDELELALKFLLESDYLDVSEKRDLFRHLRHNFGRSALCLSGGACFAYYHFGVLKALLDQDLLPTVMTGTSGGALVAALACTRTDDELRACLVPELAHKITACHEDTTRWMIRWWRTGARFDSLDWARRCMWFTRGSLTFREAYERTGRILNISCIPSDPHSPTLLLNYVTAPDCVIWSAVIASAAVPGILNPVVLMMKTKSGNLIPYSFGHKWKDGSLRTDIPIRALNRHFNVNFTIVSQVNPHVNIFFFSSRGSVGRPVSHRKGRGWRGGFLGSALEQYLKLDLAKWLKVLRHLELLPQFMSQDWSNVWLQKFDGNITIWPKVKVSDFYYILSDPTPQRLKGMLDMGQWVTFPKIKFIDNRLRIERLVEEGHRRARAVAATGKEAASIRLDDADFDDTFIFLSDPQDQERSEVDVANEGGESSLDEGVYMNNNANGLRRRGNNPANMEENEDNEGEEEEEGEEGEEGSTELGSSPEESSFLDRLVRSFSQQQHDAQRPQVPLRRRSSRASSVLQELERQSRVFVDDPEAEQVLYNSDGERIGGGRSGIRREY